jgi:excisionase family DNA binding protein
MKTTGPHAGRPAFYTVDQAAWILGVSTDRIHRAIRTGTLPALRRRSRHVVPGAALQLVLAAVQVDPAMASPSGSER